ncbi:MAG: hypothetical protein QXZ09_07120 [Candidatus Methanomethylicaceae archaeon]
MAVNVCVSRYLAERIGVPRSHVIYNVVSKAAFEVQADGPGWDGLVAFARRLVAEKGLGLKGLQPHTLSESEFALVQWVWHKMTQRGLELYP